MGKKIIYYGDCAPTLYKVKDLSQLVDHNQGVFVTNRLIQLMLDQKDILELNKIEMEILHEDMENHFENILQSIHLNDSAYEKIINHITTKTSALMNEEKTRNNHSFSIFELGDRIIVYDGKNVETGVFINSNEKFISWIVDSANRLRITSLKGISISKE
ncbi:MAG: hypothetical protein Q8934_09670 [Bacillota bacterium]|nr:hypothetical protein [Bacillota bacterium]